MPTEITVKAGDMKIGAELNDTATAKAIEEVLPIEGAAQRWGGEIYFSIPVTCELEEGSRDVVEAGELGYWPSGNALCIFFGKTPASRAEEIRAASAVNIIGKVNGDLSELWDVEDGSRVVVQAS